MRGRWRAELRLVALCTTWLLLPALACPPQCVCKWKNGKRHVECVDKDLKLIPGPLDPETQVLDFAGNDMQVLQKEIFQKLGLFDLQKIYLPKCRIHKVDNYAFKGLANLVELDLSNNYLTIVPSSNFVYFPSLMRLSLNNNPITTIKTHCFQHLTFLNTLELSECKIEQIEVDAFAGLHHLEWLRLNGNRLSNMEGDNIFPDTLRGIDLENNRWNCDCQMKDLHNWLVKFNMPHAVEPLCSTPERLRKRKIASVAAADLACAPKMSPTSVYLETNEGNNVTLECVVKAVPEAEISWWFQGQIIHNGSKDDYDLKTSYSLIGTTDKKSELFIFNVNQYDNGTYICIADNIAGRALANYTLKIIIKEEPVIVVVSFPRKHLVIIVTGVFLVIVLVIAIVAVVLLKFKTDTKSRKKKDSGKDVALRNQNNSSRNSDTSTFDTLQRKMNGSLITNAQTHHVVHYTVQESTEDTYRQGSIKNFVDRNPDIINDAETVTNNALNDNAIMSVYKTQNTNPENMEGESAFSLPPMMPRQVTWRDQQPPRGPYHMYQHSADIHLNPGCFLDNEGYPYDYGLPKMQCRGPPMHSNYAIVTPGYQTLPHKRPNVQKLGCKFAKDTEFNTTPPCLNYVSGNFRHTLDGYPVVNRPVPFAGNGNMFIAQPGPLPEGYQVEPITLCCGASQTESCSAAWGAKGTCAVMVPLDVAEAGAAKCYHVETRCVDTQTGEGRSEARGAEARGGEARGAEGEAPKPALRAGKYELEVCTESPDEGYVGDAVDSADT
ncbi:uncharacterized protein LOC105385220 [Plutella xylostella]|uniref:uncharacterized protein LOC105385220 n=1 Tax=Plutella xylostella TaxID=51655 RepID=UPI0020322021|nr:uncharacterized protein LOC105385220 [Plutella xylostella]